MSKSHFLSIAIALVTLLKVTVAFAYSGLATHDQNPLLIPYWIPHTISSNDQTELQVSSSLFITNTLQDETKLNETLVIDAETYRFNLNLQYELSDWVYHLQIPIIASSDGFMDDVIIKWHDTFGLPQGKRLNHPIDQINIQYQKNNTDFINTQSSYNGLGDISFVMVHPVYQSQESLWNIGFGLNLPTGDDHPLISNNTIDSSLWFSYHPENKAFFATLGVIKPGKGGVFKNELKSSVIFAQTGLEISYSKNIKGQMQFDYHSSFIQSESDALGDSLQMQLGLRLTHLNSIDIQLFFSEDILVGSAPDITFGLQLDWKL